MMWSNLKVGGKIAVCFAIPAVIIVFMSLWAYRASLFVSDQSEQIRTERLVLAGAAHQMEKDVIQIQQWLTDISATRGQDGLNDGFSEAEKHYQSLTLGLSTFRQAYEKQGDKAGIGKVDSLGGRIDAYYAMGKKMANAYVREGTQAGNRTMGEFDKTAGRLAELLQPFILEHTNGMENGIKEMDGSVKDMMYSILFAFVVMIVAVIAAGGILARSIIAPLSQGVAFVRSFEHGDLTGRLKTESRDEIGQLLKALQTMGERMQHVVGGVRSAADDVAHASREIASGNINLSQRTEEQASSIEETAASMEEMTVTVKQNADHASRASELATSVAKQAEESGRVVNQAVSAMGEISTASTQIANIIGVIDEIAFQTNLLALNAAVEAARAGDQGRGFAVVAAEVRNLAKRSATASTEVKQLIQSSLKKVHAGSEHVNATGTRLKDIIAEVEKLSGFLSEIATASQEQSYGVEQVNKAIMQMEEVTRQNAALVEEATAASASLQEQGQRLKELMGFFKIEEQRAPLSSVESIATRRKPLAAAA